MIIEGLPKFSREKDLFDFLVDKEETIFAQAKAQIKEADSFLYMPMHLKNSISSKSLSTEELLAKDVLDVTAVINTTGILDSHRDVHIKGLWDKSLKENSRIMHVQEHKSREFDKIISNGEDLKAYVKTNTWRQLGFDFNIIFLATKLSLVFISVCFKPSNLLAVSNGFLFKQFGKS